jgi:hypothetical protein
LLLGAQGGLLVILVLGLTAQIIALVRRGRTASR